MKVDHLYVHQSLSELFYKPQDIVSMQKASMLLQLELYDIQPIEILTNVLLSIKKTDL
jgi:hypothetical protein